MTDPEFKLTDAEKHSAAWARISERLQKRLAEFREDNDGNLDDKTTAKLRGRIAELKYLLGTAESDEPAPVADNEE